MIFSGILYTQILEAGLLPFIQRTYPSQHRFQQDNDPKHKSRFAQDYMRAKGINWWPTPPESPEMNPIENDYKPTCLEDLKTGIKTFWRKLTPQVCSRYIDHLHTVMPVVIEKNGEPNGY